jgi:transcriptional regulator with XRE-family HTH domain
MTDDFRTRLRVQLAHQDLTYLELARRLERPVSTLSSWLRGVAPAPLDLAERIESALGVPAGTLTDGGLRRG